MTLPLPDDASLEQLKNQARELHKASLARDPQALARLQKHLPGLTPGPPTLSQAQCVIARECGFPSWPRLKAHLDALAPDPMEQFKAAVQAGSAPRVRSILRRHPSLRVQINAPLFSFDAPAVCLAKNNKALIEVLLKNGADINARSRWWAGGFGVLDGATPEAAAYLMAQGAHVDAHAAAGLGMLDQLEALVTAQPGCVNARGGDGQTPLHVARTPEIAAFLLDRGAEMETRDIDHGSTPVQYAVAERPAVSRLLLSRGANDDIFLRCALGDIPAVQALLASDPSLLRATVDAGPHDPDPAPGHHIYRYHFGNGATPLMAAARCGQCAVAEMLLKSGADVNAPHRGATALHLAAWQGYSDIVRLLIAHGADRNRTDKNFHATAAGWAAYNGRKAVLGFLLQNAGIIDAAAFGLQERVEALLVGNPALVNGPDPDTGPRPLHASLRRGHLDVTRLLLERGADPNLTTEDGKTALAIAQDVRDQDAADLLRRHGAK